MVFEGDGMMRGRSGIGSEKRIMSERGLMDAMVEESE